MAVTREEVGLALIAADKAGDTEDARELADYLRQMPVDEPDNMSSEDQVSNLIGSSPVNLEEGSWTDDPDVAARMLLDGFTLGWGNEGLAAIYAAGQTSKGIDYQTAYNTYFDQLVAEENEYKDQYPAASLTLQMLGGLGTGVFGLGRTAAKLGMKGLGGLVAEGAAIGAVAGAGSTDKGDRLEGAAAGAMFGGAASGALGALGKGINVATRRRIEKDLDVEGEPFTPITLAENAPAGLKATYRDVIGSAFWGQSTLLAQQSAKIEPLIKRLAKVEKELDVSLKKAEKSREASDINLENAKNRLSSNKVRIAQSVEDAISKESDLISVAANKQQDANEFALRSEIFRSAIPEGTPIAARESIGKQLASGRADAYQSATKELQEAWSNHGYQMLKELPNGKPRVFRLSIKKLREETDRAINADPTYSATIGKQAEINPNLEVMLQKLKALTTKQGRISGEDLAGIRATARQSINSSSNNPNVEMSNIVFAKLEQNLTKTIKEQLDAPSLTAFNQTQKQYGTKQLLESVSKKAAAAQNGGAFTAKEWISTLSGDKFTKGKVSTGTAPFQKEAQKVNNMSQKIAENTKKELESLKNSKKLNTERATKTTRKNAQKEINRLKQESKGLDTPEILALKETVDASTAQIKKLESEGAKSSSIFASLAGTGFLGYVAGDAIGTLIDVSTGGLAGTLGGMVLAKGLAGKGGQKIAAGQTANQASLRRRAKALQPPSTRLVPISAGLSAGEDIEDTERYRQRMMNREFSQ